MKEFLDAIVARLEQSGVFLDVRRFNSQLENLTGEIQFAFPAALVELRTVAYKPRPGGELRDASAELVIHILHNSPLQGFGDDEVYTVAAQAERYLNRYTGGGYFRALDWIDSTLDQDHDQLYDYQITYRTGWIEQTPPPPDLTDQELQVQTLAVAFDLDVDNPTLRTGDGRNPSFGAGEPVSADPINQFNPQQIVFRYARLNELAALLGQIDEVELVAQFTSSSEQLAIFWVLTETAGIYPTLITQGDMLTTVSVLVNDQALPFPLTLVAGDKLTVKATGAGSARLPRQVIPPPLSPVGGGDECR